MDGWVPPQLDVACPQEALASHSFWPRAILIAGLLALIIYCARGTNCVDLNSQLPYTAFPPEGRRIGAQVGTPTELREVSPYQAPGVVQF